MTWGTLLMIATAFWFGFIVGIGGTALAIAAVFVDWS